MFVHHNVVVNSRQFLDAEDSPASVYYNLKVYNNSIYHSGAMPGRGIFYGIDRGVQGGRNTEFYNNIFSTGGTTRFFEMYDNTSAAAFPMTLDYNNYYTSAGSSSWVRNGTTSNSLSAWANATGREASSRAVNPQFQNSSGQFNTVTDFKLAAGSPLRNVGRNQQNMGAYTDDSLIIGYTALGGSTPLPSAPRAPQNLRVQ